LIDLSGERGPAIGIYKDRAIVTGCAMHPGATSLTLQRMSDDTRRSTMNGNAQSNLTALNAMDALDAID
jgi:hypothetical protein